MKKTAYITLFLTIIIQPIMITSMQKRHTNNTQAPSIVITSPEEEDLLAFDHLLAAAKNGDKKTVFNALKKLQTMHPDKTTFFTQRALFWAQRAGQKKLAEALKKRT